MRVTVEDVEKYLLSKVFEDPDDIKTRKLLVNTFIRDILWYGDHIVITYNFQEYATTDRFCKSYVEQLEKQVGDASRSASSFPLCSYKFRHSAPKSRDSSRDFLLWNNHQLGWWLFHKVKAVVRRLRLLSCIFFDNYGASV